ncbi:MAG: hypothetical protein V7K98_04755 [Nostoc sp.]|uniref:hypothetical protein n=1 Tax=Nostoc sp. TaxID=1180 RepID=UPI002FFA2D9C
MSEQQSQQVQNYLKTTVQQGETPQDQKLVFDPTTGELVVQTKNDRPPSPDAVVADQIAEEGFFSKTFLSICTKTNTLCNQLKEISRL